MLIAGRACDTAIFASLPTMLGFPAGLSVHMAKIIECASLCCLPGGRNSILATLDEDGFELESMAEQRRATPVSVAAHSLYEQADPYNVYEPEGRLDLSGADYAAVDDRRCRVTGAKWRDDRSVREDRGRALIGERAVLLAVPPIRASSRSIARFCPRSPPSCATWSARIPRKTTRCASASMAWTACAWRRRRTNLHRAKCS